MIFTNMTHASSHRAGNVVLKITIECLVFTVVYFQICKIATTMLGGQRTFLHIDIMILLFLLGITIRSSNRAYTSRTNIIAILIIEGPIGYIV